MSLTDRTPPGGPPAAASVSALEKAENPGDVPASNLPRQSTREAAMPSHSNNSTERQERFLSNLADFAKQRRASHW